MKTNFKIVETCLNCKFIYNTFEGEYWDHWCNSDKTKPPTQPFYNLSKNRKKVYNDWRKWKKEREVHENTKCDEWKERRLNKSPLDESRGEG